MKLLLDTHLLLWAAGDKLPAKARNLIEDRDNELFFSAASLVITIPGRKTSVCPCATLGGSWISSPTPCPVE